MIALITKIISIVVCLLFSIGFYMDILPEYATMDSVDGSLWSLAFSSASLFQLVLLSRSPKTCLCCRLWGDAVLQASGLLLMLAGGVFISSYPPATWAMFLCPLLGVYFIFVGRWASQWSRHLILKS